MAAFPKIPTDFGSSSAVTNIPRCKFCGNVYRTIVELVQHEKIHQHQLQCKFCPHFRNVQDCRNRLHPQILRVYVCHMCGFECPSKDILTKHLDYHFEQQIFETILNMEQENNECVRLKNNFFSGNYHSDINNLLFYLTDPHDQHYARLLTRKVACQICSQNLCAFEYKLHLKIVHSMGNN